MGELGLQTEEIAFTNQKQEFVEQRVIQKEYVWRSQADNIGGIRNYYEKLKASSKEDEGPTFIVHKAPVEKKQDLENATFVVLCRDLDVYELLQTMQTVQDRFNNLFGYDWVILNDQDFGVEFITLVANFLMQGTVKFGRVPKDHWSYPSWIDLDLAQRQREIMDDKGVYNGGSESYRHMCRFFLGFFYKHPLLLGYQYYWRIEPGMKILCDINYDVFRFMRENSKKYAFGMSLFEYEQTIPTLWEHFKNFTRAYNPPEKESFGEMMDFVQNDDTSESYNHCHFWSNFEIADFSVFRNPHYQAFFNYLDKTGGFFYERWGDAPVHSLAVLWFLSKQDFWWFDDIGYSHPPYEQCPQSLTSRLQNRCSCDPREDYLFSFISCSPHLVHILHDDLIFYD